MKLTFKPDWESCKKRYEAWWAHEDFGRAGIWVTSPVSGVERAPYHVVTRVDSIDQWLDKDFLRRAMNAYLENTFFGGEAVPIWNAGQTGWDALPAIVGCAVSFSQDAAWWHPIMEHGCLSSYTPRDIAIDTNNRWFKLADEFRAFTLAESKGRAIPSTSVLTGAGDALASLRTTEQLIYDLIDEPDTVAKFEIRMMELWIEYYEKIYEELKDAAEGSAGWFQLWAPGKFYASQCDFAYMISPEDFERCFLPAIEMQTNYLDYTIHHVDGEGNFRHVDLLCQLLRLQALQILPGPGKPSPLAYPDVLQKVQRANKNLHITIPPEEIKTALDMLSSRGLMIDTWANSQEDAEDIIRLVEKNSVVR